MKIQFRMLQLAALAGVQIIASCGWCAIPHGLRSTYLRSWKFTHREDFSRGFDIAAIRPVQSMNRTTHDDIAKLIPYDDMRSTSNSGLVAAQILDRSLSTWFNSEAVRRSEIGRTAHQVEKSMEGDVSFGGEEPSSIKHQLKFIVKATQTRAEVEYTGLTNAQVTYYVLQEKTNIEVREPVRALNTQVVYNHITSKDDLTQMVSFRWKW